MNKVTPISPATDSANADDEGSNASSNILIRALQEAPLVEQRGRLVSVLGTSLRIKGVRARIGDMCEIATAAGDRTISAEVVGFTDGCALLTPLGPVRGLAPDSEIILRSGQAKIPYGSHLMGRVYDAALQPIDGLGPIRRQPTRDLRGAPPGPMEREPITKIFETGVRAIDGLMTLGQGQRIGIFAAAGSGKSTLLGMLARHAQADAFVIALIGERGREVREFVEDVLGEAGLAKSIVIAATSDRPAMERVRAAEAATAVAEGLRDEGKHVVLMMDSITRFARAHREIGLAAGEPAVRRGFPPSIFAELPQLFERAGTAATGAITAIYTVLLEDEDGDPIGEEVRSLLDGHIHLSRKLATKGHYPAIDVLASLSRLAGRLTEKNQEQAARRMRSMLAMLDEIELLIQMGEYQPGQDPLADSALAAREGMNAFLQQQMDEKSGLPESKALLRSLAESANV